MAILSISRVQVRRGLQEDLPQLASGEFGWSLDERRLFIGNGTTEEGAPLLGNTEILTQYSDMLSISGLYTYKGEEAGYTVMTGASALSQVQRSLQNKLDDFVNGKDFGIKGDGTTNDVDAINHAIEQLHNEAVLETDYRVRRTLKLAAGIYILSGDYIRLSPYVKIVGEGKFATLIVQTDETQPCALMTVSAAGLLPGKNDLEKLSIKNETANDVVIIDAAQQLYFKSTWIQGPLNPSSSITGSGNNKACIRIEQSVSEISDLIFIEDSDFSDQDLAIFAANPIQNLLILGGHFKHLYRGVDVGQIVTDIENIKVTHSLFENIFAEGFIAQNGVEGCVSAFNTYRNVGNGISQIDGVGVFSNVIKFTGHNSYSIGDTFGRSEDASIPAIDLSGKESYALRNNGKLQLGLSSTVGGRLYTLAELQTAESIGVLNPVANNTTFNYVIDRGANSRRGTIKIITDGSSTLVYDDTYLETDDVGVDLIPVINGNGIDLTYTSTVGGSGTIKITSNTLS